MNTPSTVPAASQIHALRFGRGGTKVLIGGIPESGLCEQFGPAVNHAQWIAGHLACTDDYFLKELSGADALALPEDWHKVFGADPVSDASTYPPMNKIMQAMDERHEAIVSWYEGLSADDLARPMPEKWQKYAPTIGDMAGFIAWHEAYHGGQISVQRRALGLKRAFG